MSLQEETTEEPPFETRTNDLVPSTERQRCVLYLRVSTKEQAGRDGEAEGFSIPAQRKACWRKAKALDAEIVAEFVDAGESARSTKRPELQELLRFIAEHPVDYLIVHKVDRLARNRADDVMINLKLQAAGVQLVSCSENIDETPSGQLLHGIMATIAEFYSGNLGAEALKGMREKAQRGGTVGKAPIGYRNVGKLVEGREIRAVEVDPDRGPLVTWAFEAYATGEWTVERLLEEVTARGLRTLPTPTRVEKPVAASRFHAMFRNRYYVGKVTFKGVEYDGKHPQLIDLETFNTVQAILDSRRNGEKERRHHHYLKGTVICGGCSSRLCITHTVNRHGTHYTYFFCIGHHRHRTDCEMRTVPVDVVESLVEQEWATITIDPASGALLQQIVQGELDKVQGENRKTESQLRRRVEVRREQRHKLLDAYYSGALSVDVLKVEQQALTREIESLELKLASIQLQVVEIERGLRNTLEFLYHPQETYRLAPPQLRRQLNQAVWQAIEVHGDGSATGAVAEPFATFLDPKLLRPIEMVGSGQIDDDLKDPETKPMEKISQHSRRSISARHRELRHAEGLKESNLAIKTGGHRDPPRPLAWGLKEGGLAAPTGFEPVSPP
jgi:site-specific DNA recombinase